MASSLQFFLYSKPKWHEIPPHEALGFTLQELCENPVVLRFLIDGENHYFTADGVVWSVLEGEGKSVRHLGGLFEPQRKILVSMGFGPKSSIYDWTLNQIFSFQRTLEVFHGAKEVLLEAVQ